MQLTLGMMKTASTRPAVRAPEDRLVTMGFDDLGQRLAHQFKRIRPAHRHKGIAPALQALLTAFILCTQPGGSNHRLANTQFVGYGVSQPLPYR